ncbi:MAG: glycosyltransferase family 2 protein [Planctomycetota bacterium]|jgi:glycosyltransferase
MKVSIITVCFDSAKTIEDAIRSVLSQDYKDIEYIVIDGGSTDTTLDILTKYRGRINNCISEPDHGIYHAMNKGLQLATGDIVGFLNADDFYANEKVIGRIVGAIRANNADCCYGDLEYVATDNPGKVIRRWKSKSYQNGLFKKGWHPPHPTFFVKKQVYQKYGHFDPKFRISADYELMLRFLQKHGIRSCYIPNILVRMRTGGQSNKTLWQIITANFECYQAWKRNNLNISPLIMLRKPISKLIQYVQKD